ncbi:uncharacterized protein LOC142322945 [Lycorma delicatula]|uniref:uncharacterized protein LOC142322945 n=1 Tax=Lycorma delicatula TaxID=130591 RepID=UPI003F519AA6
MLTSFIHNCRSIYYVILLKQNLLILKKMKSLIRIIVINIVLFISVFCLVQESSGPYVIKVKSLSECKNTGTHSLIIQIKVQMINKTHHAVTSNITSNIELNNDIRVRTIAKFKNGGADKWINILDVTLKMCDAIERHQFKNIVMDVFKAAGEDYKCPVKKGTYKINNYTIDFNEAFKLPVLPYGNLTSDILFYSLKRNRLVLESCINVEVEIAPKN